MAEILKNKRRIRTMNINLIRKTCEKVATCIENYNQDVDESHTKLISFRDVIVGKYVTVKNLDDDIQLLIEDENQLQLEADAALDFELFYKQNVIKVNKFLEKKSEVLNDTRSTNSSSAATMKLPRLKLKSFDGQPENWQNFLENFECAIHNNDDLTLIQKMTYLRNLVEGQAASTIAGLQLTNANYNIALNLLKERYDNKQLLISSHMKTLLNLERIVHIGDISSLRRVYDIIEIQIRSLENLGIESTMYGPLLIPVLLQKIPDELNLILSRQFNDKDCWDIKLVLNGLKSELLAREKTSFNTDLFNGYKSPITAGTFATVAESSTNNLRCVFCDKNHKPQHCRIVTNLDARKKILKEKRRCFRCLRLGHLAKECNNTLKCYHCSQSHHAAVCHRGSERSENRYDRHTPDAGKDVKETTTAVAAALPANQTNNVMLQTASATVKSAQTSKEESCRLLFDNCSQLSYITPVLRNKLHLPTISSKEIIIKTFGNNSATGILEQVELCVKGLNGSEIFIRCYVKDICSPICGQNIEVACENYKYLKGLYLADSNPHGLKLSVDILVGADFYWSFMETEVIRGDGPVALRSKLGYVLSGPSKKSEEVHCAVVSSHCLKVASEFVGPDSFQSKMSSFWDIEGLGGNAKEKDVCIKFHDDIRFEENQYVVKLPFKDDHGLLGDNYSLCLKRFASLQNKLKKDANLLDDYNRIVKDQLHNGIIEKTTDFKKAAGQVHYLPHRPVVRNDKLTTKVRMVFDASASTSGGTSLNNCLHPGPSLTAPLYGILLRFRAKKYVFIADIEKAFLQISLDKKHRDFVRFLWYDDLYNVTTENMCDAKLATYRLCRVLFGVTSSPFLLTGTLITHAERYLSTDPEFVHTLLRSLHVDDLSHGDDSISGAFDFYTKCKVRLKEASFNLRKFESNSRELETSVQEENFIPKEVTKVLGLTWNKVNDTFIFKFTDLMNTIIPVPTKRDVIRFTASIYDPLGLLNPVIVRCKILFQCICVARIGWDVQLSGELLCEWQLIVDDFLSASSIIVPRWYINGLNDVVQIQLHGFCDASVKAYGCCVYLRVTSVNGYHFSSLITSKSRVAPVGTTTIPRLELRGTLLLANLLATVYDELKHVYEISTVMCWSDSTICLHWINNVEKQYEPFVQKRLQKVRQLYNISHWNYVETSRNPADIISRGTSLQALRQSTLWFNGPDYLLDGSVDWPCFDINKHCLLTQSEEIKEVPVVKEDNKLLCLGFIDVNNFNDYNKLIRVTALVLRFINNMKKKLKKENVNLSRVVQVDEIESAQNLWLKFVQQDIYDNKAFKQLQKDLRFFKKDGIIRCKGRLENAPISFDSKFPVFLPRNSRFTELVVIHYHSIVLHNGVKETLNQLRTKFWIPKARNFIRSLIRKCYLCKRFESQAYSYPLSPPLPRSRLNDDFAFKHTGLDYAGPLYVRNIYAGGKLYKAWIFLFTCASTRSVCLDLVPDCTASTCIRGLKRFFGRRGVPSQIISDNGAQFSAVETQVFASSKGISWTFNVAAAPWWGGMFERMVKSTKRCLKKVLASARLTYEEVLTLLSEIELITNNRPLTFIYEQPGDEPLSPNHLLFGRKLTVESNKHEPNEIESNVERRNEYMDVLIEHYWNRWRAEYVTELREFHKSSKKYGDPLINVNDVVIIQDDKQARALWNLGIVDELKPSRDGAVRSASVRYISSDGKSRHIDRPVNKLYQLECANRTENKHVDILFIDEKDIMKIQYA